MSPPNDDGFEVSAIRDASFDLEPHGRAARYEAGGPSVAKETAQAAEPAVTIVLSEQAKAALERIARSERVEQAERAKRGAREIAAAAGVSATKAEQAAQPLRSPPPAKGVALYQANLAASANSKK